MCEQLANTHIAQLVVEMKMQRFHNFPSHQSPIPNPQSPIPNPQSPIPNPQSPIPNPQSPIPNPQLYYG
ncbi:MAG: hypothetical protein F6K45_04850 [Kamptonema sp. SIO1D9]|nr:hypothetical protein [Kamptonema sp. SIO1D9]